MLLHFGLILIRAFSCRVCPIAALLLTAPSFCLQLFFAKHCRCCSSLPDASSSAFGALQAAIVENASWFYGLVMAILLITSGVLAFSRVGNIRLGPDNSSPDYSLFLWLSMLFAAGVGIGLMFYGVAEPVVHYLRPPVGAGAAVGGENQR